MKFVTKITKVMSVLALFLTGCGSSREPEIDVEVDLVQISELPELTVYHYEGHYYSLLTNKMNWINAERTCESLGGHLATVTSAEENAACKKILKKEGITNTQTTPVWLGAENLMSLDYSWRWVTGENFSYTHWLGGEPNNCGASGKEHYLCYYTNYGWNDANNTGTYLFLCEWDNDTSFGTRKNYYTGLEKVSVEELPDAHIYKYNGHYYSLFTEKKTWEAAEEHCEKLGGHLVTIEDEEENKVVYKIGFEENIASQNVWMGMIRNSSSILGWVTNEPLNFTSWNGNNPDNSQGKENAVHYVSTESISNKWNDVASSNSYAYLCEWEDNESFNVFRPLYSYKEIRTSAELEEALANNTRIALLMNDIYLDSSFKGVSEFSGHINGNGYTIYTPSFVPDINNKINFIGTNRGTLENVVVSVEISTLDTFNNLAGVVISNSGGSLINVTCKGEIYAPNVSYVGGVLSTFAETTLHELHNEANITAKEYVGGVVGNISTYTRNLNNCSNTGDISGTNYVGGVIGQYIFSVNESTSLYTLTLSNFTNAGKVSGVDYVGGVVGRMYCGNSWSDNKTVVFYADRLNNIGDIVGHNYVGGLFGYANSDNSSSYIKLSATKGIIIGVCYVGGIAGWAERVIIDSCSNTDIEFSISDFEIDSSGGKMSYVGGYVGRGYTIRNCDNFSDLHAPGYNVGGIAGWTNGNIENCNNFGNITSTVNNVGGIAGYVCAYCTLVKTCANSGNITGTSFTGGIIGKFDFIVNESTALYTVTLSSLTNVGEVIGGEYVSGIIGYLYCRNSWSDNKTVVLHADRFNNTGNVTGKTYVGGCFGHASTDNNSSYLNISNTSSTITGTCYVGCVAGYMANVAIDTCTNTDSVLVIIGFEIDGSGNKMSYVGGIVGRGYHILNCNNSIEVSAAGYNVGGIAGWTNGNIENCNNYANVTSQNNNVGGIVGYASAYTTTFKNCSNSGNVTGVMYVGGIVGNYVFSVNESTTIYTITISSVTNYGNVTGSEYVAGIIGYLYCRNSWSDNKTVVLHIDRMNNYGEVTGDSYIGAYIGYGYSDNNSSYIVGNYNDIEDLPNYGQLVNIIDKDAQ